MSEGKIVDVFGRSYDQEKLVVGATSEDMASIVESMGYGKVRDEQAEGNIIEAGDRENEAIEGQAAKEFAEDARLHPERYLYIAQYVKKLVEHYRIENPLVMDFGAGPAELTRMIAEEIPSARVVGVDISQDMLDIAAQNIIEHGLEKRIQLVRHDIREVHGDASELADIVVSRNMLHRVASLQEGLLQMARATKEKGGIVFNTSFRNVSRLDSRMDKMRQAVWVREFNRRNGFPALQEAWALAYLNAPTLEEYEVAATNVAELINADEMRVEAGYMNEVNVLLRKRA